MLRWVGYAAGAAFLLFILAGFFASFWSKPPKRTERWLSDWDATDGGADPPNHGGSA